MPCANRVPAHPASISFSPIQDKALKTQEFDELPVLGKSDYYNGLIGLRDFCETAAKVLTQDKLVDTQTKNKSTDVPVTLREFFTEYCERLSVDMLESRLRRLKDKAKTLSPPLKYMVQGTNGKPHYYQPSFLLTNWAVWRVDIPDLPKLCQR